MSSRCWRIRSLNISYPQTATVRTTRNHINRFPVGAPTSRDPTLHTTRLFDTPLNRSLTSTTDAPGFSVGDSSNVRHNSLPSGTGVVLSCVRPANETTPIADARSANASLEPTPHLDVLRSMIESSECQPPRLWRQLVLVAENPVSCSHLLPAHIVALRSKLNTYRKSGPWDSTTAEWRSRVYYLNALVGWADWNDIRTLLPHHLYLVDNASQMTLEAASDFLEYLKVTGNTPDRITFDLIARALSQQGDEEGVKEVIQWATDSGIKRTSDWDNWTILSHFRAKNHAEALRQFQHLQNTGTPDRSTYNTVMSASVRVNDFVSMEIAYNDMLKRGVKPSIKTYRALLLGYMKQNRLDDAQGIFAEIEQNGLKVTTDIYNAFMLGLIKLGRINDAIDAYDRMLRSNIIPDLRTYGQLINASARQGMMITSTRFYRLLMNSGLEMGKVNYILIMDMFSRGGDAEMVRKTLTDMVVAGHIPDAACYNILIDAEVLAGNLEKAVAEFEGMAGRGVEPNLVTYEILMKGLLGGGRVDEAERVFDIAKGYGTHIPYTCYEMICLAHLKSQNYDTAKQWLDKLFAAGFTGGSHLYNQFIALSVKLENPDAAFEYYEMMIRDQQRPNAFTFSRLILAFCQSNKDIRPLWEEMEKYEVELNMHIATTLIYYYSRVRGDFGGAWGVWEKYLRENGFVSGGGMGGGAGVKTEAEEEMRREHLTCVAGVALQTCSHHHRLAEFKEVMAVVRKNKCSISDVLALKIQKADLELFEIMTASAEVPGEGA